MKILDHGSMELIETWGSDERIVEAARMSTQKGFEGWGPIVEDKPCNGCDGRGDVVTSDPIKTCIVCGGDGKRRRHGDEKLLAYLYAHKHATPFEMAGAVIEVAAPIFVFREWHRHRTQSYNEMSARYTPLPDVNYSPTAERCLVVAAGNKQAASVEGAEPLTHARALAWLGDLEEAYRHAEAVYQRGLTIGIPKELARLSVPVGRYSRMRASANLRNWLAFLSLRMDAAAQWEIRQYANALHDVLKGQFPRTMALFYGVRLGEGPR